MARPDMSVEFGGAEPPAANGLRDRARLAGALWLDRMATSTKIFLILLFALLPLGLIALFASIESAQSNRQARGAGARLVATESAGALTSSMTRTAAALRAAATALALNGAGRGGCAKTLPRFDSVQTLWGRFAIFDGRGRLLCATRGFTPNTGTRDSTGYEFVTNITDDHQALRLSVPDIPGGGFAIAEFPRDAIAAITRPKAAPLSYQIDLVQNDDRMTVSKVGRIGPLDDRLTASAPVLNGQVRLDMGVTTPPIRPIEILLMILPVLMWLSAGAVGWIVINRFVLRPLARLQRAVAAYQPGSTTLSLPPARGPTIEIRRLADAFSQLSATVAQHEADLEAGLARQTKLTREVHHRVKNNLQVVASLIHLHARGAASDETMEAYASILRRVDALAIVHRNHFAEFEENRGVALRGLISELAANLRATAGPQHMGMSIVVDVETLHVNQDNAVAIAFLFTEAAELAMLCNPRAAIMVSLRASEPGRALLTVASPALRPSDALRDHLGDRFGRVFEGLSRQLRSRLQRDEEAGSFSVEVAVTD